MSELSYKYTLETLNSHRDYYSMKIQEGDGSAEAFKYWNDRIIELDKAISILSQKEVSEQELQWLNIWRSNCLEAHKEHEPINSCEDCQLYTKCEKAYEAMRRG